MHSPGPWKLTVVGNVWGLARKGAKPREGETDVAQGSTYGTCWQADAALIRAAPEMLAALKQILANPASDPGALQATRAAIRKATTPVKE